MELFYRYLIGSFNIWQSLAYIRGHAMVTGQTCGILGWGANTFLMLSEGGKDIFDTI